MSAVSFRARLDALAPASLRGLAAALADQLDDGVLRRAAADPRQIKLLGALCLLHASVSLRQRLHGPMGWLQGLARPEDFARDAAAIEATKIQDPEQRRAAFAAIGVAEHDAPF